MRTPYPLRFLCAPLALAMAATGCRATGRLAEFDYRGRSLAVAPVAAPAPRILTGPYLWTGRHTPYSFVIAGTRIVEEVEASKARARLDSATASTDIIGRIGSRTLDAAARQMRARVVDDEHDADFVIEIRIRDYGIDAKEWNAAAVFFIDAEIELFDGVDGGRIWDSHVRARDPIAPAIWGPAHAVRSIVTAAAFASLSVDEMVVALERLADFSADRLNDNLRDAMWKARHSR